jgi:phosphoribosyl 1,2-cyclic phosphate phosphodiesterase
MRLTILGSGTSHGIPVIGCKCPVCLSEDPRDRRTRASLYIEGDRGERAVIDTGPEFRLQALRAGITSLDALFLTHAHADHLHGLDDLRPLCFHQPLPVYANPQTLGELKGRFSYIFRETQLGGGKPRITLHAALGPVRIGALTLTPIPVIHGELEILGWKIREEGTIPGGGGGTAVYLTDTNGIPPASWSLIGRPGVLIIGGLRKRPHNTHFTFAQALETACQVRAERVFLTHICHEHSHRDIEEYCRAFPGEGAPGGPAYDGLELEL